MHTTAIFTGIRLLIVMTIVTGVMYPAVITAVGQIVFPRQANGSIVKANAVAVGSLLIAQAPPDSGYFMPRPSAGNYSTVPSAASNLALPGAPLRDAALRRSAAWNKSVRELPSDLIFSSGSGVDPHMSPEAAQAQVDRIGRVRGLSDHKMSELAAMVVRHAEKPQFGLLGNARVNVLLLNAELAGIAVE